MPTPTMPPLLTLAGTQVDAQESFALSETMKYLWLTFTHGARHLVDYYLFSTEGHLLPPIRARTRVGLLGVCLCLCVCACVCARVRACA